ncbi:hypothetical protein ACN3XK_24890 [Actinomadura welshii]
MTLSRRTKMLLVAAGLAGAGTVAGAGAALADTGPGPAQTRLQIVEAAQTDAPGHDCPDGAGGRGGNGAAEGTQ